MLQPKKTKFRREQKNVMKGMAQRGNQLAFGSFGLKTSRTAGSQRSRLSPRVRLFHVV